MRKIIILKTFFLALFLSNGFSASKSEKKLFEFVGNQNYKSPNNVEIQDAENQSKNLSENWWQESVFYHIWVKSFNDSDGDGCGDFKGIEQKLDYIKDTVGCDAIWLSPIFECAVKSKDIPVNMHCYDVTDYYAVNDYFGTEDDLENLINACHERNIKIIFDFVPNHAASEHPWFKDSVNNRNGKKDWYLWNKNKLEWNTNMSATSWTMASNKEYYYGAFGWNMTDFNFRNYEVREEMKNILRFWLNKGFDGARVDAVRYLIENNTSAIDTPETHQYFQELRKDVIDAYPSPKFMVCEAWVEGDRRTLEAYFGTEKSPEFNMVFDFDQGRPCYTSPQFHFDKTDRTIRPNPSKNKSYGTFLGNHDLYEDRLASRSRNDLKKMKQATALSLLRPTVPFIYYGNEIGQKNINFGGDMRLRGPFNWKQEKSEESEATSVLNLNKTIINIRKEYNDCFTTGTVEKLVPDGITKYLAYLIKGKKHNLLCVYNFSDDAVESVTFEGIKGFKSASCLVGDNESPNVEFLNNKVVIKNLASCAYRLYVLDENVQNVFDDEIYVKDEHYTPNNDRTTLIYPSSEMYLRGSMNGWRGVAMSRKVVDEQSVWSCVIDLDEGYYEYKFCTNNLPEWGANWGNVDGSNLRFHTDGGRYRFEFNENTGSSDSIKIK